MARICLSLTAKTLQQDLLILEANRKYIDMAELRVDCLDADERLHIRSFPEMAGLPIILTIRRGIDGGSYTGGEGSRITLLAKGLAFADANRRRNFAYVDIEDDLHVPSLEEAARTYGTNIIRSWHSLEGNDENLVVRIKKLRRIGNEIAKISLKPRSLDEVVKVYRAAKETRSISKIFLCQGEFGISTSILAEVLGSGISYVQGDQNGGLAEANALQLSPKELAEHYRFRKINRETKIYAISGRPLENNGIPVFFNTTFDIEQINAVYVPVPADSVHSLMRLAEEAGISGISIGAPYSEEILPYLSQVSQEVHALGACNILTANPQGWMGYNTYGLGFTESFLEFCGKKDLRRRRLTIIGAGEVAKAVAAEVYRLKGKALILSRTPVQARRLAEAYKFAWAGFDPDRADLIERYSDIIINTSSEAVQPDADEDPIDFYEFSGRETVMETFYRPGKTVFLERAEAAGCRVLDGYDMHHRQARSQYGYFMNREFPPSLISRVGLGDRHGG